MTVDLKRAKEICGAAKDPLDLAIKVLELATELAEAKARLAKLSDDLHGDLLHDWDDGGLLHGDASHRENLELRIGEIFGHREAATAMKEGRQIPATSLHDAGAYGRCSYCGRYSDDPAILKWKHHEPCDCGKTHGYSGSFVWPTKNAVWNGRKEAPDQTQEDTCKHYIPDPKTRCAICHPELTRLQTHSSD